MVVLSCQGTDTPEKMFQAIQTKFEQISAQVAVAKSELKKLSEEAQTSATIVGELEDICCTQLSTA